MIDPISSESLLAQLEQMRGRASEIAADSSAGGLSKGEGADFKNVFSSLITEVDQAQKQADNSMKSLASGDKDVTIQEVVMKMEQADVSFSLMLEIRNKLVAAYKELLSAQ